MIRAIKSVLMCAAIFIGCSSRVCIAQEDQTIYVGDWEVSAKTLASSGTGVCRISSGGEISKTSLSFISWDVNHFEMQIANRNWQIPENAKGTVRFRFDNGFSASADFSRGTRTSMYFVPSRDRSNELLYRFLNAFESAGSISLTLPDRSVHEISLNGSKRASYVFAECLKVWPGSNARSTSPPNLQGILASAPQNSPQASRRPMELGPPSSGGSRSTTPNTRRYASSGSAFSVSGDGVFVTNFHVVDHCVANAIRPQVLIGDAWENAAVIAQSQSDDLALLRISSRRNFPFLKIASRPVRLGESTYVFGYPLAGLLSDSGNFTLGTVSALNGLRSDPRSLQISAPVQPGNSGGPMVDDEGGLLGVVTSKLDAARVAQTTGDIPQNVNFAIKSSVLVRLLDASRVPFERASPSRKLTAPEIADKLTSVTARVRC